MVEPPPTTLNPEQNAIESARRLAAQYDYDLAISVLAQLSTPEAASVLAEVQAAQATAVPWPDNSTISHIFYHSLVIDPVRAFNSDMTQGYLDYMVTMDEFTAQLQQIYDRGYVLVHPDRIAAPNADGEMAYQPIILPPGKTPLVLSIDDVSYYEYMEGDGFATDLFIDTDGRVRNHYTDANGVTSVGAYDLPPVVDDFIEQHPDFSYRGDKGMIALTGYNGVLGYRTSISKYGDTPQTQAAIAEAKEVAAALRASGWRLVSHSWGHINFTKSSLENIQKDTALWQSEVASVIGPTDSLIYAFGADISGLAKYGMDNPKFAYLHGDQGFNYYFPIDSSVTAWMQLTPSSLRQARINIDGISMGQALAGRSDTLSAFFDTASTYDSSRELAFSQG